MKEFDEVVIKKILGIYRKYCQTGILKLRNEDRKRFMEGIVFTEFNSAHDNYGIIGYHRWAIPVVFHEHPTHDLDYIGEGLDKNSREIFHIIRKRVFAECLCDLWEGKISDKILLYAALIESGHAAGIMPLMRKINSNVHREALRVKELREKGIKHDNIL